MKKILALALISALLCFRAGADETANDPVCFADPFVLAENGIYYMYGTSSDKGIAVLVSDDLKNWFVPDNQDIHLALDKKDSFGTHWFWAPEVYHIGDTFYMYYSAEEHICVATSNSPLGPFRQKEQKPMREHKGIDNSLFIDGDGTPYLFWVNFNNGNEIWSAELESDLMTIIPGTEHFCIRMSQEWEKEWPSVNEGPFVIFRGGKYIMTYSANSYECRNYGLGMAVADHIGGEWTKYEGNPIFQCPEGLYGVGHHSFFKDFDGKDRIVFHSHYAEGRVSPRIIHFSDWKLDRNGIIRINEKHIFTPVLCRDSQCGFYSNPVKRNDSPDPSVIRDKDGCYYAVHTESHGRMNVFKSEDLVDWKEFSTIFTREKRPDFVKNGGLWAPDISTNSEGYLCYYSMSTWGGEWEAGLGRATATSLDGEWKDLGKLFISTEIGVKNSIDPVCISEKGHKYLVWGSFRGIYALELTEDGTAVKEGEEPVQIAGTAYEGTYILKHGKYWYLFASTGTCCEGLKSTYQTVVGRSEHALGPYFDRSGRPMMDNHHEVVVSGGYGFRGTGHNSGIVTDDKGDTWLLYHSFWDKLPRNGRMLMLDRIYWDREGWPYVLNGGAPSVVSRKPYIKTK